VFTGRWRGRPQLRDAGFDLFLDEVGELPLELQPKLLRVLRRANLNVWVARDAQDRMRVVVMTATNRPLAQAVSEGRFREEIYSIA